MNWKNATIRALLWALNPAPTGPTHIGPLSRFLIVSTTGLGDTLWGTPAIRALRQSFPESYIAVLTSDIGFQVLQHNKHIDEIFTLGPKDLPSLLMHLPALRKKNFDAVLLFHTSQRAVLPICASLKAPHLIGSEGINKGLDSLLTTPIKKRYEHEIARRLRIVQEIGAHISDYSLEMFLRKEEHDKARHFLNNHGIPEHIPLIGLHPGAKDHFKQWPPKCFIEVGKRLVQHMGCQIIVSGNQSEALSVIDIASQIPSAIPLAGELDLPSFSALIKKMAVFITNDTGPMHLSFAVKTPTVALFGPTDPSLCGPFHAQNVKVLAATKSCAHCLKKSCLDPFCLLQIGPEAVYDAAIQLAYQQSLIDIR
ncbi:MAG: Lipopolysaccharide core heptosyltransferase RfaQ [Chlamydiae bacterium]|nr:Lipopolysaccharide core heptosyltransferase RfaQ [Chlamydiota bacterium]